MYSRGGRSFSRGAPTGAYLHPGGRRRFRGQYFRTRTSPSRMNEPRDNDELSNSPSHNHYQHAPEQPNSHQPNNGNNTNNRNTRQQRYQQQDSTQQSDLDEIKDLCFKLSNELEIVKERIEEIASSLDQLASGHSSLGPVASLVSTINGDNPGKKKRIKALNKQRPLDKNEQTADLDGPLGMTNTELDVKRRNPIKRRQELRDSKDKQDATTNSRPLPTAPVRGDDSTTQAADPSSEDKNEGEEGQGDEGQRRVFRRRKQQFNKRRYYNNRRRRNDSSERNSNDTSPQNEMNVDYRSAPNKPTSTANRRDKLSNGRKRSFPELSETEISEIVQVLKRDFYAPELDAVKKTVDTKGPVVAQELISSILDHAMCDVTSPTKLSEIAGRLSQLLVSEHGGLEFQQGFYAALSTISNREDDIAIDAPRYMETLGQILGESICPMNTSRYRQLLKRFLLKSLNSYSQKSRALLLASTMRGIARYREDRFAKDIWDVANLKWSNFLPEDTNIEQFVETEDVKFTMQTFSPLPLRPKKTPEELEKFADDITNLVEKRCTPQTLEELVRDLELELDERVDFLGTLIYAIVRGCLTTDSGDYKLDTEALNKYSSILNGKSQLVLSPMTPTVDGDAKKQQPSKKETFDAIALRALTALTKLWHQHNCPQNLMSTILLALYNHGAASYDALKIWLNSEDLKNIPGIGAARLNSKRCIEDLGASRA